MVHLFVTIKDSNEQREHHFQYAFLQTTINKAHKNTTRRRGTVPTPCNFRRRPRASSVPLIFRTLPSWGNGTRWKSFSLIGMDNTKEYWLCRVWAFWKLLDLLAWFPNNAMKHSNIVRYTLYRILPIGSMGLVYLPTWMVDFYEKCRQTYPVPWIPWVIYMFCWCCRGTTETSREASGCSRTCRVNQKASHWK